MLERVKFYPERQLYPGEVARTVCFNWNKQKVGEFEYSKPEKSLSTMCQCCKNEDTIKIVANFDLEPFYSWHGHKNIEVYSCQQCGSLWHFDVNNTP